jgi:Putative Flp pilus-assembly TadE/G-like
MTTLRSQRGQAMVMSIAFLTVLLGMAALVVDVGSWYRADRHAQLTADAAALAGAQALPDDPGRAAALAVEYADKNEGGIANGGVELPSANRIKVTVERPAPGFFSKLFGIDSVDVRATAAATVGPPSEALYVAPIVVNEKHPDLQRFGTPTELEYFHLKETGPLGPDGSGSFGFINLDRSDSNPGTSTMKNWIANGFDRYMPTGEYDARTGNPFSGIEDSLEDKIGEELLFPIYRKLTGTGSNAKYVIIGWVGFHLTSLDLAGSNEKLFGYFTKVIWQGIQGASGSSFSPGVGVVQLVE